MKLQFPLAATTFAALALAATPLQAQTTATTDPVGFVTFTAKANSDLRLGIPMLQAPSFQGSADSVSGTTVSATGIETLSGSQYLTVTSGTAEGSWEVVASSAAGSVTLAAAITGFEAGDSFAVRPFWTLNTLFPDGGAIPASSDVFNPVASVILNNPTAQGINLAPDKAYIYHDGSQGPAGWYDSSDVNAGLKNDIVVSPEVSIAIRNNTGSDVSIPITGNVPTAKFGIDIASRAAGQQDNLVYNQFPTSVTLATSGLVESGAMSVSSDVFNPTDTLIVYSSESTGFNPAGSASYLYHDGSQGPAGWYDSADVNAGLKNDVEIPAGASFVVRKAAGSDQVSSWDPSLPYTLN
jgi:uncharacterized protein (TIGR02597 family)